jgi:hypothetical protein
MSWSLSAVGTKEGATSNLLRQKVHTTNEEETKVFEKYRQMLIDAMESVPPCGYEPEKQVPIFTVSASGHGTGISKIDFSYVYAFIAAV